MLASDDRGLLLPRHSHMQSKRITGRKGGEGAGRTTLRIGIKNGCYVVFKAIHVEMHVNLHFLRQSASTAGKTGANTDKGDAGERGRGGEGEGGPLGTLAGAYGSVAGFCVALVVNMIGTGVTLGLVSF